MPDRGYELADYTQIVTALDGGTFTASSSGWVGIYEVAPSPDALPEASTDPANPTVFAVWRPEWDEYAQTFEPDDPPVRPGLVVMDVYRQVGAPRSYTFQVLEELRDAFNDADGGNVVFWPNVARFTESDNVGAYHVDTLELPFTGGTG